MNYSEQQKLEWLLAYAKRLTDALPPLHPVNIEQLIERESFSIVCSQDTKLKVPAVLEVDATGKTTIRIKTSENVQPQFNHRERFTLAHELGHGLLIRQFAWNPLAGAEHRSCESLCNRFAASLLVPDSFLPKLRIKNAAEVVSSVFLMSKIHLVSLEVAARRLTEHYSNINLLCVTPKKNAEGESVIEVRWSTGPILGETLNRKKHLKTTNPIGKLFISLDAKGSSKVQFDQKSGQDIFLCRLFSGAFLMSEVKHN